MTRRSGVCLAIVLLVSGCQPKNQLDWKVKAEYPIDLERWRERYEGRFSPALQDEFGHALTFLASSAGVGIRARTPALRDQMLCQRIDRKTVRAILVDSYHFEREFLLKRSILQTDNVVRNVSMTDKIADKPDQLERFENVRARQEFGIEMLKERLAVIDERLKQLEPAERK